MSAPSAHGGASTGGERGTNAGREMAGTPSSVTHLNPLTTGPGLGTSGLSQTLETLSNRQDLSSSLLPPSRRGDTNVSASEVAAGPIGGKHSGGDNGAEQSNVDEESGDGGGDSGLDAFLAKLLSMQMESSTDKSGGSDSKNGDAVRGAGERDMGQGGKEDDYDHWKALSDEVSNALSKQIHDELDRQLDEQLQAELQKGQDEEMRKMDEELDRQMQEQLDAMLEASYGQNEQAQFRDMFPDGYGDYSDQSDSEDEGDIPWDSEAGGISLDDVVLTPAGLGLPTLPVPGFVPGSGIGVVTGAAPEARRASGGKAEDGGGGVGGDWAGREDLQRILDMLYGEGGGAEAGGLGGWGKGNRRRDRGPGGGEGRGLGRG